jgi:hypothetical protein
MKNNFFSSVSNFLYSQLDLFLYNFLNIILYNALYVMGPGLLCVIRRGNHSYYILFNCVMIKRCPAGRGDDCESPGSGADPSGGPSRLPAGGGRHTLPLPQEVLPTCRYLGRITQNEAKKDTNFLGEVSRKFLRIIGNTGAGSAWSL